MQRFNTKMNEPVIKDSIHQLLHQQEQSLKEKIRNEVDIHYKEEEKHFLNNLTKFKNEQHAILDDYLLEKKMKNKDPNENSSKLLGQIFMHIQSIEDIKTGHTAYENITNMFKKSNHGSPTLCTHAGIIIYNLSYYFNPAYGKFIDANKESFFAQQLRNIDEYIENFEIKMKLFINAKLDEKYTQILNNDAGLKTALTTLDATLTSISQFYEIKNQSLSFSQLSEKVKQAKNTTLKLIENSFNPGPSTISEISALMDCADPTQTFHVLNNLLASLKQYIADEQHHCLLKTDSQAICQRLAIILGVADYKNFITQLCAEASSQCKIDDYKMTVPTILKPVYKNRQNQFTLFGGTVADLPQLSIPRETDAIRFIYSNKNL